MATIAPVLGEKLLVQLGDGNSPELFSAPNMINTTRGVSVSTTAETEELMDLANPSAPAQTVRYVKATDVKIDGAGMVSKADGYDWLEWSLSGEVRNIKVTDGTWVLTGPFILSSYQVSGERRKSTECQMTLEQAGPVTLTKVA